MTDDLYPQAGDVVRLTGCWPWAGSLIKLGSLGVINGIVGARQKRLEVTWNFSAFRGFSMYGSPERDFRSDLGKYAPTDSTVFVSASGGPGTIALPAGLLKLTDEFVEIGCWCWRTMPRKDGGYYYKVKCRVWEWTGKGY